MADIEILQKTIASASKPFELANKDKALDFAKEAGFAMQILKGNDYLAKLSPESIRDSIINVALCGLTLNPALKFAYLIPRGQKCVLDISYIGMIKILTDAGAVKNIDASVIYENDEFEMIRGSNPKLYHKRTFKSEKVLGAYAIAFFRDGGFQFEFMTKSELDKIKNSSESMKNVNTMKFSPWNNHESEMQKKTVLKRLTKLLPKTHFSDELISMLSNEHQSDVEEYPKENQEVSYADYFEEVPEEKKETKKQKDQNQLELNVEK